MEKNIMTSMELVKFLKDEMELGQERTIKAVDGLEDSVMPDLAIGVIKEKYFDSSMTTYLIGVYGSDYEFRAFFVGDYEDEDRCLYDAVEWLEQTALSLCGGNYGGLYIPPTDEEQQEFYEENRYNGEISRTIDTLNWGEVDMVSRFDDGVVFYDCYQKEGGGYLGEFRLLPITELDDYSDEEIANYLNENLDL